VAAADEDGAIADFCSAKAAIRLPHVTERNTQPRPPAFHQGRGRGTRAIIRDDDLEATVALARQCGQVRLEGVLAIIGLDNDGDQIRHLGSCMLCPAVIACTAFGLNNEETCKKYRPISSPSTKPKKSRTRYRACCGPTRSWWPIPAAPTARPRSRKASARGSFSSHFTDSATCAIAPSRNADTNGSLASIRTSAARPKFATRFLPSCRHRLPMTPISCRAATT